MLTIPRSASTEHVRGSFDQGNLHQSELQRIAMVNCVALCSSSVPCPGWWEDMVQTRNIMKYRQISMEFHGCVCVGSLQVVGISMFVELWFRSSYRTTDQNWNPSEAVPRTIALVLTTLVDVYLNNDKNPLERRSLGSHSEQSWFVCIFFLGNPGNTFWT